MKKLECLFYAVECMALARLGQITVKILPESIDDKFFNYTCKRLVNMYDMVNRYYPNVIREDQREFMEKVKKEYRL